MGFLDREAKVLSWIAQVLLVGGQALVSVARVGAGGPTRRRVLLAVLAVVGVGGYLWVGVGLKRLLRLLVTFVFGLPAPGQPLSPGSWLAPQNGLWPDVIMLSRVSMGVAGLLVLVRVARATMAPDEAVRRREIKRVGRPAAMVAATWTLLPFMLHLTDQLSTALAPQPAMLTRAMGSTAGAGLVLGTVTWFAPFFVTVGVLATIVLQVIIVGGFVGWPVAVVLRSFDHELPTRLGRSLTALFSVAVVAKLLQAVSAFLLVYLTSTLDAVLVRVGVFVVGVVFVLVALPVMMLRHAEMMMRIPGSLAPTERQVGRYVEASAERVGRAHTRIGSGRERFNEWRETDPQTRLDGDWTTDDSSGLFGDLLSRELSPSFTSAEWGGSATRSAMSDGVHGPESEDPDAVTNTQNTRTDQEQGRWDDR